MLEEVLVILGGMCVRAMMSIHNHSGQASPPIYGDYEAQRHWQEITVNLPVSEWYFDTKHNNLTYWGLDYPPLTAYHSWIIGKVAQLLNPSYIELNESHGFESTSHKSFMRYTVLVSDLLVLAPAAILFARAAHMQDANCKDQTAIRKSLVTLSLLLSYPGLILIDNGHFQYNNMSLGLMLAAVACLIHFKDCVASILFVAALNYKQMELYHALPFFSYLLGRCASQSSWSKSIGKLTAIGVSVILSFIFIWLPFLLWPMGANHLLQVMSKIRARFHGERGFPRILIAFSLYTKCLVPYHYSLFCYR